MDFGREAKDDAQRRSLLSRRPWAFVGFAAALAALALSASAQQPAITDGVATCPSLQDAQRLLMQKNWSGALDLLRLRVRETPACPEPHYLLAFTLLHSGEPTASLKEYTEAAKLRQPSSEDFVAIASDYILLKAYTDAKRWLERAVQLKPGNGQAWYLLGRTQYNLDQNEGAVRAFNQSLALNPEDAKSEYNLGLAYERLQQPDLARTAYETAIQWGEKKHIEDPQAFLDLGMLVRSQGHPQDALPSLQKAATLSPSNPLAVQELGRTYLELHRLDEAIAALKQASKLAPEAEPPHFFLGRALRAAGRSAEANEQFALVQQLAGAHSSNATPNIDSIRRR